MKSYALYALHDFGQIWGHKLIFFKWLMFRINNLFDFKFTPVSILHHVVIWNNHKTRFLPSILSRDLKNKIKTLSIDLKCSWD